MIGKARIGLLGLVLFCSACAAPSLRYKTEINQLVSAGKFKEAQEKLADKKVKLYSRKDAILFYLDSAALLHDAGDASASDQFLSQAQDRIDELYATSITGSAGRLLINDLTAPYYPASYEQALTYFYRAQNFLQQNDVSAAAVEARRAVFFSGPITRREKRI